MTQQDEVVVGIIGRPWGTRGQFIVDPRGNHPDLLVSHGPLRVRRKDGALTEHTILGSHFAGGRLVVSVDGVDTPEAAERWRGAEVVVEASALAPAPDGAYYPHELAGLTATRSSGEPIGIVERVLDSAGGADLLEVRAGGRTILIPFAASICSVDRNARTIIVDPPEGLLDLP